MPQMRKKLAVFTSVLTVVAVAFGLRWIAMQRLPIDYDEDDYLRAAIHYANAIKAGDIEEIIHYDFNFEHPPLIKLFYGLAILPFPEATPLSQQTASAPIASSLPEPHFHIARLQAVLFGMLEVLVLALINPLAGLFLAIDTWQIKYTSQVMLEALPSFTSLLAVFCYIRSNRKLSLWLLLSSVSLGATVAAKFPYGIVGIAILIDWLWHVRDAKESTLHDSNGRWLRWMLLWGVLSVLIFFAVNPRLWVDPAGRLFQAVQYHWNYAHSERIREVGYPPWKPLVWLFQSVPWHPGIFLVMLDGWITILALFGFRRAFNKERVFSLWLGIALAFLLLWPTKWPQYILMLTGPLCYCAAEGFHVLVWEPVKTLIVRRKVVIIFMSLYRLLMRGLLAGTIDD